ncbi:MAG: NADH-quinone oxidoreductase subunit C, partial [Gaiellaceae bacterium]
MSWEAVPGFVEEREEHGESTVVVEPSHLVEAAAYLRDDAGFNFLSDITAADYLGWNDRTVAGYWGSASGRDINLPGSWGLAKKPSPNPKRFSVSYHLVKVGSGARETPRLRLQVWCD